MVPFSNAIVFIGVSLSACSVLQDWQSTSERTLARHSHRAREFNFD